MNSTTGNFTIRVGTHSIFNKRKALTMRTSRADYQEVIINTKTTIDYLKNILLEHLGYPYPDLFTITRKGIEISGNTAIGDLEIKPNDGSLEIKCKNLELLYSELIKTGKL